MIIKVISSWGGTAIWTCLWVKYISRQHHIYDGCVAGCVWDSVLMTCFPSWTLEHEAEGEVTFVVVNLTNYLSVINPSFVLSSGLVILELYANVKFQSLILIVEIVGTNNFDIKAESWTWECLHSSYFLVCLKAQSTYFTFF